MTTLRNRNRNTKPATAATSAPDLATLGRKLETAIAHEQAICAAIADDFDPDAWYAVVDAAHAPAEALALQILETSPRSLADWAVHARAHQCLDGYTGLGALELAA